VPRADEHGMDERFGRRNDRKAIGPSQTVQSLAGEGNVRLDIEALRGRHGRHCFTRASATASTARAAMSSTSLLVRLARGWSVTTRG